MTVDLRAGRLSLALAPEIGGAIARYDLEEAGERVPLMRPAPEGFTDVLEAACFPLVPYCNRVRDGRFTFRGLDVRLTPNMRPQRHPLHGVGWRGAWTVEAQSDASATLTFVWPGGDWPWPFRATQTFTLDDVGLAVSLSVQNTGAEPMPAGLGLHPYYPCPPGTVLDAAVEEAFTVDAELFPDGRTPATGRYDLNDRSISGAGLDNGYGGWGGEATIRRPDGRGLRLTAAERWFQVYAPADQPILAAEPVTHANGALNAPEAEQAALGLRMLAPGEAAALNARFDPL